MGASESTLSSAGAGLGFQHWVLLRRSALALYLLVLAVWTFYYGIAVQRELVVAWVCGGLLVVSVGRHPREILRLVADWLPLVLALAVYDLTRGAADTLGIGVHTTTMIDVDRFLFAGQVPTEWIQARIANPADLSAWDVSFSAIYTSYFIVPFALAGVLWARDRVGFLRYRRRLLTLFLAGLATYIAFPAAPPWLADQMGLLDGVERTTKEGFETVGVATVGLFSKGQGAVNLVAAVPSLHAGITALVVLFLWPRVRPALRPLLALYAVAMGFTLVATGEHYVFDILLGWLYAGGVMLGWAAWERRRGYPGVRGRSA